MRIQTRGAAPPRQIGGPSAGANAHESTHANRSTTTPKAQVGLLWSAVVGRLIVALSCLALAGALARHLIAGAPDAAHTAVAVGLLLAAFGVCALAISWRWPR